MKVTVGVCCFKQKKWLYRCLRSLASQTLDKSQFEVVIVNDEPGSSIEDICNNMEGDLNIRLINNRENIGLPSSLNKILRIARGRYFIRVDSDDYVSKHFLNCLSLFLDMNRNYQGIACDYSKVNEVGVLSEECSSRDDPIACGAMFTYESLCEINFYDENYKMREGHDLIERFLKKFSLFHLPMSLYRYRVHESNRTKNTQELERYNSMLKDKEKDEQ
jgi:glycosyltransferase involved in cell wall biosynthesis